MKVFIDYDGPIEAPIEINQKLGELKIFFKDEILSTHYVYALTEVKKVNLFARILKSLNYLVWGDV